MANEVELSYKGDKGISVGDLLSHVFSDDIYMVCYGEGKFFLVRVASGYVATDMIIDYKEFCDELNGIYKKVSRAELNVEI